MRQPSISTVLILFIVTLSLIQSCKKDDLPTPPLVKTTNISEITQSTATSGGEIDDNGGEPITKRGICWGTTNLPTISGQKTTDGAGDGSFISRITGLSPGVLYYIRAYATNSVGTGYGKPISFNTNPVALSEVTTADVIDVTPNSAKSGGNIVSAGGGEVTARGICWSSVNQVPTTTDSKTTDGGGLGGFTSSLTELENNKTYYVRAYAINSAGTSYGLVKSFKTLPVPPSVTTKEITNRSYRSVKAGGEVTSDGGSPVTDRGICFATHIDPKFNENNLTAGSGTGPFTVDITSLDPNTEYHVRAYAASASDTTYGVDIEFRTLELVVPQVTTKPVEWNGDFMSGAMTGGEVVTDGGSTVTERGVCWSVDQTPTIEGKHTTNGSGLGVFNSTIQGTEILIPATWHVRAYAKNATGVGYGNQVNFNVTCNMTIEGFSADYITGTSVVLTVLAGYADNVRFDLTNILTGSVQSVSTTGNPYVITNISASITGLTIGTEYSVTAHTNGSCGAAVSLPITFTTLNVPTLLTTGISDITNKSVVSGGNISYDGGSPVTERGVCWSTNINPTIGGNNLASGSGTGQFSITIDGLNGNTVYHVRSYAKNSVGVAYGQDESFTTDVEILSDIDGNIYGMVQIGSQVWMAENLKATKLNDGGGLQLAYGTNGWSYLTAATYCWYNDDPGTYKNPYGALYNWLAVSSGKLCPIGWHVPSDSEWAALNTFLGGANIAGGKLKETGTVHWENPNTGATNDYNFTALPGGHRIENSTINLGVMGYWWSSTVTIPADFNTAYSRIMKTETAENMQSDGSKNSDGFSVRCIKGN